MSGIAFRVVDVLLLGDVSVGICGEECCGILPSH